MKQNRISGWNKIDFDQFKRPILFLFNVVLCKKDVLKHWPELIIYNVIVNY